MTLKSLDEILSIDVVIFGSLLIYTLYQLMSMEKKMKEFMIIMGLANNVSFLLAAIKFVSMGKDNFAYFCLVVSVGGFAFLLKNIVCNQEINSSKINPQKNIKHTISLQNSGEK